MPKAAVQPYRFTAGRECYVGLSREVTGAEDVLYTFFGQSALLSEQDVNVLLSQRFNIAQRQKLVNILLWYGVIGVIRQDGSEAFIYSVNYDMKRLTALLHLVPPEQRAFCINPAFWVGLEINTRHG